MAPGPTAPDQGTPEPQQPAPAPQEPVNATAAQAAPTQAPKTQLFHLKPVETQTLQVIQESVQRAMAVTLNLLAVERMGYPVTENTQFKLNPEMTEIEISERQEDVPVNPAQPEAPAPGGVVAAQ
jgi:hypothetical protein